jgi:ligand-binding SRPBCC domain-containing protein
MRNPSDTSGHPLPFLQRPGVRRHLTTTRLRRPLDEVFEFFSDARNLECIKPPGLKVEILSPDDITMGDGALIDYSVRLRGVPFRWRSRIRDWNPPFGFVDEQVTGPYSLWHHIHTFAEEGEVVRMDDIVYYRLPAWPFGEIAGPWVRREIERIFAHRDAKIREIFGENFVG